jgi:tRNA pseudouridine38-40 synthase
LQLWPRSPDRLKAELQTGALIRPETRSFDSMRNYKIIVEYDGTNYQGWQIQPNGRSIQGELTRVLSLLDHRQVTVHGAGRTDSGVHALGQVASFLLDRDFPPRKLRDAINGNLDRDIRVFDVEVVDESFHARYSSIQKTYTYRIWTGPVVSPFVFRYMHHFQGRLDVESMRRAASLLRGEHDFSAFTVCSSQSAAHIRDLRSLDVEQSGHTMTITATANGFLKYMVRALAGTLIDVGRGHRGIDSVSMALEKRDRGLAGPTAPAAGLTLVRVDY